MEIVRIPKDRVAILIGKDGQTRRDIEQRSGIKLYINTELGEVTIHSKKAFEPHLQLVVKDIIKANARGIAPKKANRLFQENTGFILIDIRDYAGKNKKHVLRLRGRIIGTGGKTRELIEEMSGADIAIQGNTIAILGDYEEVRNAETAVDMVLSGAEHSSAYKFLENTKKRHRKDLFNSLD